MFMLHHNKVENESLRNHGMLCNSYAPDAYNIPLGQKINLHKYKAYIYIGEPFTSYQVKLYIKKTKKYSDYSII